MVEGIEERVAGSDGTEDAAGHGHARQRPGAGVRAERCDAVHEHKTLVATVVRGPECAVHRSLRAVPDEDDMVDGAGAQHVVQRPAVEAVDPERVDDEVARMGGGDQLPASQAGYGWETRAAA